MQSVTLRLEITILIENVYEYTSSIAMLYFLYMMVIQLHSTFECTQKYVPFPLKMASIGTTVQMTWKK